MRRRIVSFAVAAMMVASLQTIPFSAFAEDVIEVPCIGTDAYYTIDANGHMTIYGSGEVTLLRPAVDGVTDWAQHREDDQEIADNVTSLTISDGITNVKLANTSSDIPFKSLQTVGFPDTMQTISNGLFFTADLKYVKIPKSVMTIEYNAFRGCRYLQNVTFAEDAQLEIIKEGAFEDAPLSGGIYLPKGLQTVETRAFDFATTYAGVQYAQPRMVYLSNQTELGSIAFDTGNDVLCYYETGEKYVFHYSDILKPYDETQFVTKTETSIGDVNLDGKVDLFDAILLNKGLMGVVALSDEAELAADCDNDGFCTDNDVSTLMSYLIFLIPSIPTKA
jgi:hypothetical protein